ncbi:hypothetical protein FRX31_006265 [Thalictrum thalictroides]|uniref:Uncharacterized protein n=1 Tax=Thalictrum thalictroides TaxID=46969 RepID=A0A7J6X6E8_THATH|nr:hypothetical protein FRX31_006265 [Thalictrum thalictroides]
MPETDQDDVFDGVLDGFCYDKDELKRSYEEEAVEHGETNTSHEDGDGTAMKAKYLQAFMAERDPSKGQSGNPNNGSEGLLCQVGVGVAEYKENSDHGEARLATQNLITDRPVLM